MNTVIKFLLYLLVLLLLVSWLVTVGKSCGQSTEASNAQQNETSAVVEENSQELMEELEEKDFSEELESILDEEEANAESEEIDYSSYDPSKDEIIEKSTEDTPDIQETGSVESSTNENESANKSSPPPAPKQKVEQRNPSASSGGNYLVVAGSFIIPDNANRMKSKLSRMGYNAEVVNFDLSEYHAVLAGRYPDYNTAQDAVNALSKKGVDAYVKRRSF